MATYQYKCECGNIFDDYKPTSGKYEWDSKRHEFVNAGKENIDLDTTICPQCKKLAKRIFTIPKIS